MITLIDLDQPLADDRPRGELGLVVLRSVGAMGSGTPTSSSMAALRLMDAKARFRTNDRRSRDRSPRGAALPLSAPGSSLRSPVQFDGRSILDPVVAATDLIRPLS